MTEEQKDAIKDKYKTSLQKTSSLNTWLLVINLTLVVTFFQQELQLGKSKKEVDINTAILHQPWDSLKVLYDLTNGPLETYLEKKAVPRYQQCLATSLESMRLKASLPGSAANKTLDATIGLISYSVRVLASYNADLRNVAYAQKAGKSFESLDRRSLKALVHTFSFGKGINLDSFDRGIGKADSAALLLLFLDKQRQAEGKGTYSAEFRQTLSFSDSAASFRDFSSEMLLRDMRTFGDDRIGESGLNALSHYLDSATFENLGSVQSRLNTAKEKLAEIEAGQFFELPLVKIQISLLQFIIFGGMINLVILLNLFAMLKQCRHFWQQYQSGVDPAEIEPLRSVYFYGWTFGIKHATLFSVLYALFLSFVSIASLIFALAMLNITRLNWPVALLFAIINLLLAFYCARRYRQIPLNKGNVPLRPSAS
ncbi:hypothetical protein [Taibaiella koreensis]|uniref:hypothetical protein n=1 Tax=Taibaiella koreensis TaxID=1268548 RepID=UPI000E5A04E3|nr:hypothetical protein [Taibaiella koreensis]